MALSLASQEKRTALRKALRDSRITDHKVLFANFARTPDGEALLRSARQSMNESESSWTESLASVPAMDLYVPFEAHRKSWLATDDVLVAASFDPDAEQLEAFDVTGKMHVLRRSDGTPSRPLVIMHPSEPTRTIPAEMLSSNGTIEGDRMIMAGLEEGEGGGGGGGGGPAPGVYLTYFYSYRDDGWWGALEMSFRSWGWEGLPIFVGYWQYPTPFCSKGIAVQDFPHPRTAYTTLTLVSPGISNVLFVGCNYTSSPRGYELEVKEMDGGANGDNDDFGRRFFFGGANPFGATVGAIQQYWSCDGRPVNTACGVYPYATLDPAQLSVDLKLEYR